MKTNILNRYVQVEEPSLLLSKTIDAAVSLLASCLPVKKGTLRCRVARDLMLPTM